MGVFDLIFTCEYMMARVAVVTGSNKGIGYAIIRGLCKNFDGDVYLTARDVGRGEEAVAALKKEGLNPKFHQLDISNGESIKTLAAFLKEKYGGVDVFVNNAAIAYKAAATEPFAEQAEVSVDVNFFNTLNVCKNILPITKTGARVVHVASMAGPFAFKKSSDAMKQKYLAAKTLDEVCELMKAFVAAVQVMLTPICRVVKERRPLTKELKRLCTWLCYHQVSLLPEESTCLRNKSRTGE